jgi:simple sugar transport system permease protein
LTIALAAPLILAAMGGYTSERTGVINIGLEGMMLLAACATAVAGIPFGPLVGLGAGMLAAISLSLLHWLMTQKFSIDHVISGMAINAIALGGSNFLFGKFSDPSHNGGVPHFDVWLYYGIALVLPLLLWLYSRYTRGGLRMLATGADPDKSRLMGLSPVAIRFWGLLATGVFTALGGALLVSDAELFTDNMTAGRGFIALAALIVGGWRPLPTFLICLAFGFFSSLQLRFQGTTVVQWVPSQAWAALPYVVTIVALAGFLGRNRTPAGLGKP